MTEQSNANVQTSTSTSTTIDEPGQFHVYLLNDDYTPMDFVTEILKTIFKKSPQDAEAVMMKIHEEGKGIAGTYVHEIAEQKAIETTAQARSQGHPLNCTVEKA